MNKRSNSPVKAFFGVLCTALVAIVILLATVAPAQAAPLLTGRPPEPKCAPGQITVSSAVWVEENCVFGEWSQYSPGDCPNGSDESGEDKTCEDNDVEQYHLKINGNWGPWHIGSCPPGSDESGSNKNCEDENREAYRTRTKTCTPAHWIPPVCQNPTPTNTLAPSATPTATIESKVTFHHCDQGFPGNGGCVSQEFNPDHAPTGWELGPCPEIPACFQTTPTNTNEPTATLPEPTATLVDPTATLESPTSTPSPCDPDYNNEEEGCGTPPPSVNGCTDESATNYNPAATVDDGSCEYPAEVCTNQQALNYGEPLPCVYDPSYCDPKDGLIHNVVGDPPVDALPVDDEACQEQETTGQNICDRALIFYNVCFPKGGGEPGFWGKLLLWIQSW